MIRAMYVEVEEVEKRLNSFFPQLKSEHAILDRFVYKNKNQHRRCSYFQFLLKFVFHVVTNGVSYGAMQAWLLNNDFKGSIIEVQNIEGFSWLNSSYAPIVKQILEEDLRAFDFDGSQEIIDEPKLRNQKYIYLLKHLRFYIPEIYLQLEKVRRYLRLLESAHLDDLVSSCFHIITDKKPKQKLNLLESLKKRKCDSGKPNFLERLLGAARLLSQMVEPMLKAATNISTLLAQSFFMGFSLAILALLARLRVLVQQILLDVVTLFNIVSALSRNKHSMKINQEGIEVFREYFPTNKEVVTLECSWETDKFVLLEKTQRDHIRNQKDDRNGEITLGSSHVQYDSINAFLGDDEMRSENANADGTNQDAPSQLEERIDENIAGSSDTEQLVRACTNIEGNPIPCSAESPNKGLSSRGGIVNLTTGSKSSSIKLGPVRKVAFLSVKRPAPSTTPDLTSVK